MTLANDLNLTDIDKALALRQFSGGGSGSGTTGPTGPTGPSAGPTGPTGGTGPTGPSGAATNSLSQTKGATGGSIALTGPGNSVLTGGAITVTVPAGGGKAVVTATSSVNNSGAQQNATMALLIDGVTVEQQPGTVLGSGSLPFSITYESNTLTAGSHTIDFQGSTAGTMTANNSSLTALVVTV